MQPPVKRPVLNKVFVIDISHVKVITAIGAGKKAQGVTISKHGTKVYVTDNMENTVSVKDVATQKVTATVPEGKGPDGTSY